MAKKVRESRFIRFEYKVINEKWFVEAELTLENLLNKEEPVPYYHFYLKRGNLGTKRFLYGCPKTSPVTGETHSIEEEMKNVERMLLHSIIEYVEEEDAIAEYYEAKFRDADE